MNKVLYSNIRKIAFCLGLILVTNSYFATVANAEYPSKNINLNIAFAAGGSLDVLVRELFNQSNIQVISKNITGGGGIPVLTDFKRSKSDGYTLAAVVSNSLIFAPLVNSVPYKSLEDFTPIITFAQASPVLITKKDSNFENFYPVILLSPISHKIKVAIPGFGTPSHIALLSLAKTFSSLDFTFIPFSGPGEAEAALLGGHVDLAVTGSLASIQSPAFTPLLALSDKALPAMPELNSFATLNIKDPAQADSTFVLLAPKDCPAEVIKYLEEKLLATAKSEQYFKILEKYAVTPALRDHQASKEWLATSWQEEKKNLAEFNLLPKK